MTNKLFNRFFGGRARLAGLKHKLTLLYEERQAQEAWQREADIRLGAKLDAIERRLAALTGQRAAVETWEPETLVSLHRRLDDLAHGGRATFVGDGRLINRATIGGLPFAFYLEAGDRLLTPWFVATGHYEHEVTDYLLRSLRSDSRCIDAGANFGYFTCLMAKFAAQGQVVGVEPDVRVYELARDNVMINGLMGHASVRHAAVSNAAGELTLYRRMGRSGNNSIAEPARDFTDFMGESPSEAFQVPALRIDDLAAEMGGRVDFIKIDVEGAEPLVLAGAAETIKANPDLQIVMEWSPGQVNSAGVTTEAFVDQIARLGLKAATLSGQALPRQVLAATPYQAAVVLTRA